MTKAGGNSCKLPLKVSEEDKEETQAASLADAKETSVDAAASEQDGVIRLKRRATAAKAFSRWNSCCCLSFFGFGKSVIKHRDALQLATHG